MEAGKPGVVGPGGAATSEGVLANFFNSLLSKKTGQAAGMPGAPGAQINAPGAENCKPDRQLSSRNPLIALSFSSDKAAAVRSDAAAELDRLTRSQKKVLPSSGPSSLDNSLNNSSSDC